MYPYLLQLNSEYLVAGNECYTITRQTNNLNLNKKIVTKYDLSFYCKPKITTFSTKT